MYLTRHKTTSSTMSVGNCKWLYGVPVRSLNLREQVLHLKVV